MDYLVLLGCGFGIGLLTGMAIAVWLLRDQEQIAIEFNREMARPTTEARTNHERSTTP